MTSEDDPIDRAGVCAAVITCAAALDARDWALLRSLFADRVVIDLRAFRPDLHREVSRGGLVKVLASVAAFDRTRHRVTDPVARITGDRATCVAAVEAEHFLTRSGAEHTAVLRGTYTHALCRTPEGWRIDRYALVITGRSGDPRVFAWAGMG